MVILLEWVCLSIDIARSYLLDFVAGAMNSRALEEYVFAALSAMLPTCTVMLLSVVKPSPWIATTSPPSSCMTATSLVSTDGTAPLRTSSTSITETDDELWVVCMQKTTPVDTKCTADGCPYRRSQATRACRCSPCRRTIVASSTEY